MAARSPVSPARRAAYEVLLRVFEDDAYADRAFAGACHYRAVGGQHLWIGLLEVVVLLGAAWGIAYCLDR